MSIAESKTQRFDPRSGLAISVVWNQRLGDGGPEQRQLEPTDELVATSRWSETTGVEHRRVPRVRESDRAATIYSWRRAWTH